ncbi:MAG TPA: hypothetical protein VF320_09965 [Acidimicrobiales bacterium]
MVSASTFSAASSTSPQTAAVTSSSGAVLTFTYTGSTGSSLTGITGWTVSTIQIASGAKVTQSFKPNLCTSGTPQLLKLRVSVGWGPNTDVNNVQDSVILNYPPSGIQTLGFIALQLAGDTTANDSQGDPWSIRVQAPPVTIAGVNTSNGTAALQTLTIYPDNYGCAFAQVLPTTAGTAYTVSVANASSGIPSGTTYGSPSFVANGAGVPNGHVIQQPTSESQSNIPVGIGAVTKLVATYPTAFPGYDQGSTVNLSYPSSSATEDGVSCPGVGQITCLSAGENSAGAVLTWSNLSAWSNVSLPGTVTRISSVSCAGSVECEAVGYAVGTTVTPVIFDVNPSGPSIAVPSAASLGTALNGVTSLSQVACPSATTCVAIGTTATGAAVLTDTISASGVDAWVADSIPATVTGLTSLVCPAGATGCAALGTSSSPLPNTPVVLSGGYGAPWAVGSASGFTLSSLTSLTCPTTTTCLAIGQGTPTSGSLGSIVINGIDAAGFGSGTLTWTLDKFPTGTTVNSVSAVNCPPTSGECLLTGKGTGSVPLVMEGAITASATFANDTLPTTGGTVTSLTQMACPTAAVCVLIGATASNQVILSGAITGPGTPDTWSNATVPSVGGGATLSQLTQVACWSASVCAITGTGTNPNNQPSAFLLATHLGVTGTNWQPSSLPGTIPALYLTDVDCTGTGTGYCSAVGATATGAVEYSSTSDPTGSWSDLTPANLAGYPVQGVPVEMNNAGLLPSPYANVVTGYTSATVGSAANTTQLPDLYPFNSGYGLFAGDCSTELGAGSFNLSQAATTPGGTSTATIPLGLLSVQALHSTGNYTGLPNGGATLQLTGPSCGSDVYNLQIAGPDGLSRTEVPFGTYTLKVTNLSGVSATAAITVGGSSVVSGGITYPLPTPVPVSLP